MFSKFKISSDIIDIDIKLIIYIVLIIIGTIIVNRIVRWLINKSSKLASEKLHIDLARYKFYKNTITFIIWLIAISAIISLIPKLRTLAIAMLASAGILVAIFGFAAQHAFSNIMSGLFLIIFKPFTVGDLIKVGSLDYGTVEDITLRHTVIKNFENKRIIIPNSVISSETIINDTIVESKVCRWIDVGISYDSDIDLATRIIQEEASAHPMCIDVRTKKQKTDNTPIVLVRARGFGDSSINLRAFVWTNHPHQAWQMHSDINIAIKKRFDKEGVEIPFPYRTVVYKKDLPENSKSKENA